MRDLLRRLPSLLVVSLAAFAGAAGVAYATTALSSAHQATSVIQACENPGNGTLRVVADNTTGCHANETAVTWNVVGPQGPPGPQGDTGPQGLQGDTGPQGPAGTFTGTFTSPNGDYSLHVTDTGISLQGPAGRIGLTSGELRIESSNDLTLKAGNAASLESSSNLTLKAAGNASLAGAGNLALTGGAVATLDGGILQLNGCHSPLAVVGGLVDTSGLSAGPTGGPVSGVATIAPPGVPTVCVG